MRKGEILGLKFEDFDFQRRTVTIQRQLVVEAHMDEEGKKVQEYELVLREPKSEQSNRTLKDRMGRVRKKKGKNEDMETEKWQYL